MKKRTKIELKSYEREVLEKYVLTGNHSVHLVKRAKVILALDAAEGRKPVVQTQIAKQVELSRQAINDVKAAFLNSANIETFLQRKKRETPPVAPKITGELEAHIIALACSEAPKGCSKWTLRLLSEKCVELQYVDELSHMSVSRLLKKHNLSLT
jgi:hypothetical protein